MPPAVLDPAVLDRLRQLTTPGEPDVMLEVLQIFLDEAPKRIARLHDAWRNNAVEVVQRSAHSLKGSSGNIGADALFEVCRQIDERARTGALTGSSQLLVALDREYAAVESAITQLLQSS